MSETTAGALVPDETAALASECERFTRYLIDEPPSERVRQGYLRAHRLGAVAPPEGASPQDRATLQMARRGGTWLKMADVHARFFQKGGLLRRKLVLLLALLETDGAGRRRADRPSAAGPMALFARMAWWGIVAGTLLIASVVFVGLPKGPAKEPSR